MAVSSLNFSTSSPLLNICIPRMNLAVGRKVEDTISFEEAFTRLPTEQYVLIKSAHCLLSHH